MGFYKALGIFLFVGSILIIYCKSVTGDGHFELDVISYVDPKGDLADGSCCDSPSLSSSSSSSTDGIQDCMDECDVAFRVCLTTYQPRSTYDGRCVFGEAISGVLGGNTLLSTVDGDIDKGTLSTDPTPSVEKETIVKLPIKYAWPTTFTLLLEALDVDGYAFKTAKKPSSASTSPSLSSPQPSTTQSPVLLPSPSATLSSPPTSRTSAEGQGDRNVTYQLIERVYHSSIMVPSPSWVTLRHDGLTATVLYRVRLQCDDDFYGTTCMNYCTPRDDLLGHYTCDDDGGRVCDPGWTGSHCMIAICKKGCHATYGFCDSPDECRCRHGWQGELCDQCMPYPGCKHGGCVSPWQCNCEYKWGGLLCDQDLDFCGSHTPCQNNGICINIRANGYACRCPDGFGGGDCELSQGVCHSNPCMNGGTCSEVGEAFICDCTSGWTGEGCNTNIDDCVHSPCLNGGSCSDLLDGYECHCTSQWQGPVCQYDSNECTGQPCVHAFRCRNRFGDYLCDCQPGWTGRNCDVNANDCVGHCFNGATCMDLINSFICVCRPGFTGTECETNVDECISNPCLHGGTCTDLVNGYQCECIPGFSGTRCQYDVDLCNPNPCKHGANCFNLFGDYFCACPESHQGKNCSDAKTLCQDSLCQVIDSCTVTAGATSTGGPIQQPSNVCGPHGSCISLDNNGGFSCICDTGYTGLYCHERIDYCESNPCQNGGTCINSVSSIQCVCTPGWEGIFCNIGTDECSATPCRNNGTCVDLHADFTCVCPKRWMGKSCNSLESHCDSSTCRNDGACEDTGESFMCLCPPEWEGISCQIAVQDICISRPCVNGATCIPSGESYTCICKDGFEGANCDKNVDDCRLNPCHNGGKCVDGINWFLCQCAEGFAGPSCRININECLSSPCAYGSTCVDGMTSYTCHCPLGRNGTTCSQVIGYDPMPRSCQSGRHLRVHEETWQQDCNRCRCDDGLIVCSKVWCGPSSCLAAADGTFDINGPENQSSFRCSEGYTCRPIRENECFTPPCHPWGVCEKTASGRTLGGYEQGHGYPTVHPGYLEDGSSTLMSLYNTAEVVGESGQSNNASGSSIRLFLTFNLWIMPVGMTVDAVCNGIRQLPQIHAAALDVAVFIMCRKVLQETDTIDLTMSTDGGSSTSGDVSQALISGLQGRSGRGNVVLDAIISIQQISPSSEAAVRFNARLLILAYMVVLLAISFFGFTIIAFGRRRSRCHGSQPPPPPPLSLPLHILTGNDQSIVESETTTHRALNNYIIDEDKVSDKSSMSQASSSFTDDHARHYMNDVGRNEPVPTGYLVPDFERSNRTYRTSNKRRGVRRPRPRSEKEPT
nr:protein jagged-1b-like [Lytechinus pictus]